MRMASVVVKTCTFCFRKDGSDVAATTAIPITLTELEDGGFTLTYAPTSDEESSNANACDEHADKILTDLEAFKTRVQTSIVESVRYEESAEGEDTAEEWEDFPDEDEVTPEDLGMDEEDVKGLQEHVKKPNTSLTVALGKTGQKVTTAVVSNPKPEDADKDALIPDAARIPPTEVIDLSQPKGSEKERCREWYAKLPLKDRNRLRPQGWPSAGKLNTKIIEEWRTSDLFLAYSNSA